MTEPIYMRIGSGGTLHLPQLVGAMGNFLGLLREIDSTIAERKIGNLQWRVTTLEKTPNPLVGVTPTLRKNGLDTGRRVERELIQNIDLITLKGERGRSMSDAALTRIEALAKTAPHIGPSSIYTSTKESLSVTTTVSAKTLEQVREITGVKSTSYGVIKGKLDTISVRRGLEFRIWDETSQRSVRCLIDAKERSQALALLGTTATVSGVIAADRHGRPVSMQVSALGEYTIPDELPTIEEMRGFIPDFTGGLSLKQFLEDTE